MTSIAPKLTHDDFVGDPDHAATVTRAIADVVGSVRTGGPLKGP